MLHLGKMFWLHKIMATVRRALSCLFGQGPRLAHKRWHRTDLTSMAFIISLVFHCFMFSRVFSHENIHAVSTHCVPHRTNAWPAIRWHKKNTKLRSNKHFRMRTCDPRKSRKKLVDSDRLGAHQIISHSGEHSGEQHVDTIFEKSFEPAEDQPSMQSSKHVFVFDNRPCKPGFTHEP